MKKRPVLNLSLDLNTQEKLRFYADKKTNGNISQLIRELLEKYLFPKNETISVVLNVPTQLKGEDLQKWLNFKSQAIFKALQ